LVAFSKLVIILYPIILKIIKKKQLSQSFCLDEVNF